MWLPRTLIPAPRPKLSIRLRRASAAAWVLVAASLALTACSSAGQGASSPGGGARSSGSPVSLNTSHSLNTAKIQLAIENSALAQRGRHVRVTCPSGVPQQKGITFSCTAYYGHSSTPFTVTELDGLGNVHYAAQ